jgi:membrane protease YdiL (CAAX protease family)
MELPTPVVLLVGLALGAAMALLTSFTLGPSTTAAVAGRYALSAAVALGIPLAVAAGLGWWRAVGLTAGRASPWGVVPLVLYWLATVAVAGFEGVASRQAGVLLLLVTGIFFAAFGEEVIFRGILLHGLARTIGGGGAVVFASLLFALYHVPVIVRSHTPSGDVLVILLVHFGFGVFMCRVRAETESLWFPTGMHTLSNVVVIAFWVDPSDRVLTPFGMLDAAVVALGLVMAMGIGVRAVWPRVPSAITPTDVLRLAVGEHARTRADIHRRAAAELRKPGERGMFARFTQPSRRAVIRAQEEARIRGEDHVTTEHLLVGVIAEADETARESLTALGVDRAAFPPLEEVVADGWAPPDPPIPFTPRAKGVFERTLLISIQLSHPTIESSHLLLGLISQERGDDAALFRGLGIDRDHAEAVVLHTLVGRIDGGVAETSAAMDGPASREANGAGSEPA